jgi:hypothetical protein
MKDLIIGASTNYDWDKLKYWINSINKSGFEGDKVLILMNCDAATVKKVNAAGFKVIGFNQDSDGNLTYKSEMPIHVERFGHIYEYLRKNEYRYVITTDVKDVIFQSNPIDFLEANCLRHNLVFSSESMLYKDEPWGNQNLLETFGPYVHGIYKENEIYNVGVLAGTGSAVRDLAINIFTMAANCPIPICDQSTFNFMVSMSPYKETSLYTQSETGWTCQLGTTADPSKINQFKPHLLEPSPSMYRGIVTTSKGIPYHIVHQYDRVPEMRRMIEEKYGE